MADKLQERVEKASESVHAVVDQAEKARTLPAKGGPAQSSAKATDSTKELVRLSKAMEAFLADPAVQALLAKERAMEDGNRKSMFSMFSAMQSAADMSPQSRFKEASKGHEKPERVFKKAEEAHAHSLEQQRKAEAAMEEKRAHEQKGFFARMLDSVKSFFKPVTDLFAKIGKALDSFDPFPALNNLFSRSMSETAIADDVMKRWLSKEYLGAAVHARLMATPPILTVENRMLFQTLDEAEGGAENRLLSGTIGRYSPGTNHIMVRHLEEGRGWEVIAHEELHYASWLGGGHDIRYMKKDGTPVMMGYVEWLHEGSTELHAQQLANTHRHPLDGVSYGYETLAAFYIQKLVGEDVMRSAYLCGDFSEVMKRLDAKLGEGTFERIIQSKRGADALAILVPRMDAAKVAYTGWDSDPVAAGARRSAEVH